MYHPDAKMLNKYADILVNFALNSGKGVKKGEVVLCLVPDIAKPMLAALQKSLLKSGAHPLARLLPTGISKSFFELANQDQLKFFPEKFVKCRIDLIDHFIRIVAEHDLRELKDVDPKKIMLAADAKNKEREWMFDKEYRGKLTWTLALYGTKALAKEASLSEKEYWQEIIKACFLDRKDPIAKWKEIFAEQERIKGVLNKMKIKVLLVEGEGIDFKLKLGEKRKWVGGSGRNIPSFEIFTSPDWRGAEGRIDFNQPCFKYGNVMEGIKLEFENGRIKKASAEKGEQTLLALISRKDANKIGEFSLTDSRFSRITKFMASTLYDENIGGKFGNMHIAAGMSYKDAYDGDPKKASKSQWKKLGFNNSGEHCDFVTTFDRKVVAMLAGNKKKIIYENGKFRI